MHHAAVWIDHHEARIFDIGEETFSRSTLRAPRVHVHRRHPETVDHEHPAAAERFLHDIALALVSAQEILVVGPASAKHELVDHIQSHDRQLASRIVGVETVDHPSDGQLAAFARKYFRRVDAFG